MLDMEHSDDQWLEGMCKIVIILRNIIHQTMVLQVHLHEQGIYPFLTANQTHYLEKEHEGMMYHSKIICFHLIRETAVCLALQQDAFLACSNAHNDGEQSNADMDYVYEIILLKIFHSLHAKHKKITENARISTVKYSRSFHSLNLSNLSFKEH